MFLFSGPLYGSLFSGKTNIRILILDSSCPIEKNAYKLRFQIANDTVFRAYDYGSPEDNQKVYGQKYPPVYSLDKVTVPLSAYYAQNDWLVVPQVGTTQCLSKW